MTRSKQSSSDIGLVQKKFERVFSTMSQYELAVARADSLFLTPENTNIIRFCETVKYANASVCRGKLKCSTSEFFLAHAGLTLCDDCASFVSQSADWLCERCLHLCGAHRNQIQELDLIVKIDDTSGEPRLQRKIWLEAWLQQRLYERHPYNVAAPVGNYRLYRYYIRRRNQSRWLAAKISVFAKRCTLRRSSQLPKKGEPQRRLQQLNSNNGNLFFNEDKDCVVRKISSSLLQIATVFNTAHSSTQGYAIAWHDEDFHKPHNIVVCERKHQQMLHANFEMPERTEFIATAAATENCTSDDESDGGRWSIENNVGTPTTCLSEDSFADRRSKPAQEMLDYV